MRSIWVTFLVTGIALLGLAIVGLIWRGDAAPVFHLVGRFLLVLAVVTALFPSMRARLGSARWAATYIAFVVVLTVIMMLAALDRARALRS